MNSRRIGFCAAALFAVAATFGVNAQIAQDVQGVEGETSAPTCDKNHYILHYGLSTWVPTGDLNTPRGNHTATLLADGKVLVAGGRGPGNTHLDSAELYDPATGSWSTTGRLTKPRVNHTATLLPGGKVLVVGGDGSVGHQGDLLAGTGAAELYDPTTGSWTPTGNLNTPRAGFTATLLTTGEVLVAGGVDNSDASLNSAELYDPTSGTWSYTGDLITARLEHTATPLQDGRILVVAGWTDDFFQTETSDAELYDPVAGTWSSTSGLQHASVLHAATRLQDGSVLVVGGYLTGPTSGSFGRYVPRSFNSAELYDPTAGTWASVNNINGNREGHTATLLPDGTVLVAGGFDWNSRLNVDSAESYDPVDTTWRHAGSLGYARSNHTATLLPNGKVLVAGGYADITLGSAELYDVLQTVDCPTGQLDQ